MRMGYYCFLFFSYFNEKNKVSANTEGVLKVYRREHCIELYSGGPVVSLPSVIGLVIIIVVECVVERNIRFVYGFDLTVVIGDACGIIF